MILNNPKITRFATNLTGGSIYDFSKSIKHGENLTECGSFMNLTGRVEHYVIGQRENGNVSGSIRTQPYHTYIGIESYMFGSNYGQVNWTEDKISMYNSNKSTITIANLDRIYCNGYTEEEIQQNIASGGIWEGLSRSKIYTFTIKPL